MKNKNLRIRQLNLTNFNDSDVKYSITRFPDGQQSVEIDTTSIIDSCDLIEIASRLNSFKDLELIISATQSLYESGVENVSLFVPYFLGARSDRKFTNGSSNYLKTVICPIINSQGYVKVTVIDPHSDVLEACLNNFNKIPNHDVVNFAIANINDGKTLRSEIVLVSPDAGAMKKIYDVAKTCGVPNVITASKVRDITTGKILATEVPNISKHSDKIFLIIDDICDGGRTFVELAKSIKEQIPDAECYLCVTHGIFSAGLLELSRYFKNIYSTNSYGNIDACEHSDYTVEADFLKQLNIF